MAQAIKFEDALTETDFGFIICGETGRLKGLWIPTGNEDGKIPSTIVKLCKEVFGIDPTEPEDNPVIH